MKRVRNMFLIIVLNIFLMLLVSVLMEYDNLAQRLSLLENNIDLALTRSIDTATASEELFSAGYQESVASHGVTGGSEIGATSSAAAGNPLGANVTLWGGSGWYDASAYVLASYYEEKHMLPPTMDVYNQYQTSKVGGNKEYFTRAVYAWLFGQTGHNYGQFTWCNTSVNVMSALEEAGVRISDRKPTTEFKKFYNKIGKSIVVNGVVKHKLAGNTFETVYAMYPVLDNMGLDFGDDFTSSDPTHEANYMTDNFCMSEHAGKKVGSRYTLYYITPYSLGVTYVPIKVLKPVFIANLDTMARLQRVASGDITANANNEFAGASNCVSPSVYTGTTFTQASHYTDIANYSGAIADWPSDGHVHMVTDGNIEYVLDTVQMRVDYYTADFYKSSYNNIASRIEGPLTGQQNGLGAELRKADSVYQNTHTGVRDEVSVNANGNRIVAKITVRMKVHILYQSSILQWLSYKDWLAHGATGEWHASIKEINPSTGLVIRNGNDGTWFETSTYFAVTR